MCNIVKGRSAIKVPIFPSLWAEVITMRKTVFPDKFSKEQVAIGSNRGVVMLLSTKFMSQAGVGTIIYRKKFPKPFMNIMVVG